MLIQNPPVEMTAGLWMLGTNEYPVYLVKDGDQAAIFEGGVGVCGPIVAEQLASIGVGADCVKQVLVTHAHPDHVMAIPAFRKMFGGVTICASEVAAQTLCNEKAVGFFSKIDGQLTEALIKAGSAAERHRPEPLAEPRIPVDRILRHGETVAVGEVAFEVLATPGHSDCSLSFHLPGRGILVVSDATGFYIPRGGFFWPCYFADYGAYIESLRMLAGLDAEFLCLSHNAAIKGGEDVKAFFDAAIAATESCHKRILEQTEAGKCSEMIGNELGSEVYAQTQLLSERFFQKNCALLVKESLKFADK